MAAGGAGGRRKTLHRKGFLPLECMLCSGRAELLRSRAAEGACHPAGRGTDVRCTRKLAYCDCSPTREEVIRI